MTSLATIVFTLASCTVFTACAAVADTNGPTARGALATDAAISRALQANDTLTLHRLLAGDWIVVSARGGWAGRDDILQAIKAGVWTHTLAVVSKPRVRLYGGTALVTEHATVSGMSRHKPYLNVQECQTDVLVWKSGAWISELLHESYSKTPSSNC